MSQEKWIEDLRKILLSTSIKLLKDFDPETFHKELEDFISSLLQEAKREGEQITEQGVQEAIWQHLLDKIILDDGVFEVFTEGQWRYLKKVLYPLTHESVRDFIPSKTSIEMAYEQGKREGRESLKKELVKKIELSDLIHYYCDGISKSPHLIVDEVLSLIAQDIVSRSGE